MDDWKKRAAVLTAFGIVFGAILFAVKSLGPSRPNAFPVLESPKASAEKKASATDLEPAAPVPPVVTPRPPNERKTGATGLEPAAPAPPVVTPRPSYPRTRRSKVPQTRSVVPRQRRPRLPEAAEGIYQLFGAEASNPPPFGE